MNQYYSDHSSGSAPASSKGGQPGAPQDATMAAQLKEGQEPVSGKQGKGTADSAYDQGNQDEMRDAAKRVG